MNISYCVYVVQCFDRLYYTGVTNDIDRRLWEHNTGFNKSCYTFKRRPVTLKYLEEFDDINEAIDREKQIKGWSRKKKEALIRDDLIDLVKYSQRRSPNR